MVECSPATRAARVRFPDDARLFVNPKSIQNTWQSPKKQVLYYEYFCFLKLPPSCRQFSKKPFNSITLFRVDGSKKFFCKKVLGGAGYRSRYLSHAKRALYHLSYAPIDDVLSSFLITVLAYMYLVWLLWRSPSNSTKLYTLLIILHLYYVSFDSSVGRAVDCSCIVADIHRSLVQIRLEGLVNFSHFSCCR